MPATCPTCREPLAPGTECRVCAAAAAVLAEGDSGAAAAPPEPLPLDPEDDHPWREQFAAQAAELPAPATELPDMLPPPLEDPARSARWYLLFLILGVLLAVAVEVLLLDSGFDVTTAALQGASVVYLLALIWILPHRKTGILYLRSFQYDRRTIWLRKDLQYAFGRTRVSGIRDPQRRSSPVLRFMEVLLFALRYATPRYMNLEAEDDWKARLWRSMCQARGAVIDITDRTRYVVEEMWLSLRTVGLERILFVADGSKKPDEWRAELAATLRLPPDAPVRIATWASDRAGRRRFRKEVAEFARSLPKELVGLHPEGSELAVRPSKSTHGAKLPLGWEMFIAWVAGTTLFLMLHVLGLISPPLRLVIGLPLSLVAMVYYFTAWWNLFLYALDYPFLLRRLFAPLALGTALMALPLAVMLPSVQKVREAAARMHASDQLKHMTIAMHGYHDQNNGFPPAAACDKKGKPLLSWRVAILPYVGEGELYKQFKLDEPWDSEHNKKLIEKMPKVFQHPWPQKKVPPGYTHYRVFVSPPGVAGPHPVFREGRDQAQMATIPDGTSNTILIAEAEEAVPWTKPDELVYAADRPLPKLGGHFRGVFLVVLADGAVLSLPADMPEAKLRALITADDGEVVKDY